MVYLKAIEANGFKSFADKVDIKFDSGVTAVVGPNGSGKSNITDAIRWVLGEQSARTIRGVKMEDVIFSGTDTRSEMNAATVKLKLDNQSGMFAVNNDEVIITRKLFRSGDSEYYINNERSKLKEIHELFLDSGLGRNAYNIISQGEVDTLLKARPEERRTLIEEAAGVMKYKLRRKESEKRLTETKDNLNRVNDIIKELEERVNTLEIESANAEEYLALKNEMSRADIEVSVHDIKNLSELLKEETDKINWTEAEIKNQQEESSRIDAVLNDLSKKRDEADLNAREVNKKIVDASKKLEQVTGKIELFTERKNNKGQMKKELEERLSEQLKRRKKLETELTELNEEIKTYQEKTAALNRTLKDIKRREEYLTTDQSEEIEQLKDDYYQLMVEKTTLENDQKRIASMQSERSGQYAQQMERMKRLTASIEEDKTSLEKLSADFERAETELSKSRAQYKEMSGRLNTLRLQYDNEREKLATAKRYLEQQEAKLEMLKSVQNEYRGYFPGVRTVLKNRTQLKGVVGSVGEMISTEDKYVTALDTALGGQSQSIIMETDQDAQSAIQFLKKGGRGFATFLPQNTVKSRSLSTDLLNLVESYGKVLADIVEAPVDIRNIVSHLLSTTVVVDTMDHARQLARESRQRLRIVTLDGETIMPGGAMSGGSRANKSSIIESKKEISDTEKRLADFKKQTASLEKSAARTGEDFTSVSMALEELENSGTSLKEEYEELKSKTSNLNYRIESKTESLSMIENEVGESVDTMDMEELSERISLKDKELSDLDDKIRLLNSSDKEKKDELKSLTDERNASERELLSIKERMKYRETEQERVSENLNDVNARIERTENEQEIVDLDLSTFDINALNIEQEKLTETVDALYEEADRYSETQHDIKESYQKKSSQREDIYHKIDRYQHDLRIATGRKEKLDTTLEQRISYLSEEYKLTFERAEKEYTDLSNIEQKRVQISLNKKSIEELGPVNLGSIEEFERVNTRYRYLKEQEDDLLEARETLLEVINEMDEEVSYRFKETFEKVNSHFGGVFKEMFGGGQAELRLTEDGDYLESGVEIYAQPPGKKLSTLSLLSGGERALTAISLLFSILKVRTSPFIILDEVEAALDEANVVRFAKYLRNLSNRTQFIVITHRKGTMEEADRLFGVTMQERGVSQLISVDLKDYEESAE